MKRLIILSLLFIPLLNSFSQSKKELKQQKKIEEYNDSKALVESWNFEFSGNKALPQKGGTIDLTSNPNFLRVTDSSAWAELPYFGRAYNVAYGGPGGIKFKGEIEDYSIKENEQKLRLIVSFSVKDKSELFNCSLLVNSRNNVSLSVTSHQRDLITYYGIIEDLKKED